MSILDIAKLTIYDFHYGYMKKEFGCNCAACYSDTDSLVYEIQDQDPYQMIKRDCHICFDTSDYPPDNQFNIPLVSKKVLGFMKDENNGVPMTDFVGLRSKPYTLKTIARDEEKMVEKLRREEYKGDEIENIFRNLGLTEKAKGVKKEVVKTKIIFDDYVECLEKFKEKYIAQTMFRAVKHKVYTISQNKLALSPNDDKRYLIPGSYDTYSWGHHILEPMEEDIMMEYPSQ